MRNEIILQKLYGYSGKLLDCCQGCTYETFSAERPEIPWGEMDGLRNRIVHDYEGVNLRLVWEIISGDIPALRDTLQKML